MPDSQLRVLVFEEDEDHARHLKKILSGCDTVIESSLYQATRRFKNSPFDLSIVSLEMPDDEGEELAHWLLENYPRRQVILTGSEILAEQEELLNSKSVLGFFASPLPPQVLASVMHQSDRGLRGQVQRMQVSDLLQALRYSQKALSLMFEDAILQQEAQVYLQNGDITHVEVYQRNAITRNRTLIGKGHEGFEQLMAFKNGTFSEQVWQEPPERSVMIPFDGLMMNAAQKRDESLWTDVENVRIRKALLIDNEAMSRMMLQQGLLSEGIDCQSLRGVDMILEALEEQQSELLILDSDLAEADVRESLTWLKQEAPRCRVLFLGTPRWEKEMPVPAHILPRPISPKRLKEILFELTQVGFRGFLNRIGVLDFLQLNLAAIDESKKLHIRDLSNRIDGQIFIDRGRFIHAEFGDLQGEDAFYRIAAIEKGDFFEDPSFQPPAQTLADIMPHKLMIRAGQFAKPLEDPPPLPVQTAPPAATMTSSAHLEGVAAKMDASAAAEAGALNLFGEDDLKDISLNFAGAAGDPPSEAGGVTSLFGDDESPQISPNLENSLNTQAGGVTNLFGDDEASEITLNLGQGLLGASGAADSASAGGVTSLFGDDEADEIKLNLGAALGGEAPGGITNLFGDDEADEITLNLGQSLLGNAAPAPAETAPPGGVTNLFGDDEVGEISLNLGKNPGAEPQTQAAPPVSAVPVDSPAPSAAEPAVEPTTVEPTTVGGGSRLDEMRARWAERRANMSSIMGPGRGATGPLNPAAAGERPAAGRTGPLTSPARPGATGQLARPAVPVNAGSRPATGALNGARPGTAPLNGSPRPGTAPLNGNGAAARPQASPQPSVPSAPAAVPSAPSAADGMSDLFSEDELSEISLGSLGGN